MNIDAAGNGMKDGGASTIKPLLHANDAESHSILI